MLNAVIHLHGSTWHVATASSTPSSEGGQAHTGAVSKDPGPIVPEIKELAWGAGSFIVFAVLMRWVLFPKLKRSMDARYQGIQNDHAGAEAARTAARAEVADYEAQVSALTARLGEQRAAAAAEVEAARQAATSHIAAAVGDVAARAGELATGRRPSDDVVGRVVSEVMAR